MPIYEYKCSSCGKVFEKMESITSTDTTKACVACGEEAQRQISQTAFHLKGGGWYSSGYSSSGKASCGSGKASSPACASCPAASE